MARATVPDGASILNCSTVETILRFYTKHHCRCFLISNADTITGLGIVIRINPASILAGKIRSGSRRSTPSGDPNGDLRRDRVVGRGWMWSG